MFVCLIIYPIVPPYLPEPWPLKY
uniref:Uncharacterized protein n=1 Tax=Anguilla anguilla TaxID=7936 RepID=A0A0E9SM84_ANGAN